MRGQLGRVLFSGDDVEKKVGALSGGEAARLVFCRIMVEKPNVLVLDEPTNHLDLEAIDALVEALRAFERARCSSSRTIAAFVSALATRILEVTPQGFRDFPGTYDEYLERCGDDHLDADAVVLKAKKREGRDASRRRRRRDAEPALSWEEQKKRANRLKQLPAQRDKVVAAIEAAEARKAAIHALWCEPGFYEKTPPAEVAKLEAEEKALGPKIDALLAEWEALEAEMAQSPAGRRRRSSSGGSLAAALGEVGGHGSEDVNRDLDSLERDSIAIDHLKESHGSADTVKPEHAAHGR